MHSDAIADTKEVTVDEHQAARDVIDGVCEEVPETEEIKENALKLLRLFLRLRGRDGSIGRLKDR